VGLAYAFEPRVIDAIAAGRLVRVLEPYAVAVPGFFLCFQGRSQSSAPLRLFVDMTEEISVRKRKG
jgi:DNA-binding transcriptional LysR family regulator